ncbi:probable 4-hydroxy-tetrahydrodipicolinate reductase 1, chloroplastic [Cryptomeria japonica]|uniref:probable 4-hydroxy-tetrahydrodipicolinate reductase 1, chloroplastic n=1 Tax=Cryptomeria japonica TaxID=3369 RepID=UPI0025AD720C|nr:probable 4-hydroxy-tetrahydrodipicolinate reductase 1, chloroplastic [Cryptomeria japonica]XP_059077395.1 probable 4-hydroxy-tetrahydrodipicolinate reductase 1, chloroplastic [Cryptomeria japonica]XP_059077396.1 probable 4-hydroxy-tetrahydrodipicolinate reductase 1, chloroplastic [Cryptomeria japonica]XP_059077397.1 probable 4-hydroxy-tetrahydrodipicolinate reductase 1, chloroplastic [Cryptomeria japonica]
MGRAVAEAALSAGLQHVPLSLTSLPLGHQKVQIGDVEVDLRSASEKDAVFDLILKKYPNVVVVDYTVPSAVNENAELYCRMGVPFVMGTTGGDRKNLLDVVRKSNNYAGIVPQMGKQVVAFQAAMEIMVEQFPGAFSGYKLECTESHQSSKVDTSGTAKAIVSCFQRLGVSCDLDQIKKVRDRTEQIEKMGVPENYLGGHAFHTYRLTSPDNTVAFQFQHNVCGRSIYAQGTVDAVLFLAKKVKSNAEKRLYNMIDVLREGNMR